MTPGGLNLILGVTTYNRADYLKQCLKSWDETRNRSHRWTLIVADDGSTDRTFEIISNLDTSGITLYVVGNHRRGVHQGTNEILRIASTREFDYGFKIDDDLTFTKAGWDDLYVNNIRSTGYDHLVFFDRAWGKHRGTSLPKRLHPSGLLVSYTSPDEVQGAFWTFTKRVIEKVGYFDAINFGPCGYGHTDYTMRCCRAAFNDLSSPFDCEGSDAYISLIQGDYKPAITYAERNHWNTQDEIRRKKSLIQGNRIHVPLKDSTDIMRPIDSDSLKVSHRGGMRAMISFVIPLRGREDQIDGFIKSLEDNYKNSNFEVIISEQKDDTLFKRGQLCNLGFKKSRGDIVVFQDIDIRHLEPLDFEFHLESLKNCFVAFDKIAQLEETAPGKYNILYKEPRLQGYGACAVFTREQFIKSNGFSNLIIGWGAEDNIMAERSGMGRVQHTLGHVKHFQEPRAKVTATGWHQKNVYFWQTDSTRDRVRDSFLETTAVELAARPLRGRGNFTIYPFKDITVTEDFPYKHYLQDRE